MIRSRFFYFCIQLELIVFVALVCNSIFFSLNPFLSNKNSIFKSQTYFSNSKNFAIASKDTQVFKYYSHLDDFENKNMGDESDHQSSQDEDENNPDNEDLVLISDSFFVISIFKNDFFDIKNYHPIDKPKLVLLPPPKYII
jgi:hypothetical protein